MLKFSELKRIPLREKWKNEASEFTPWLESNIQTLGDALGMDLEVVDREASVGDFSLDLRAQDLGSSRTVVKIIFKHLLINSEKSISLPKHVPVNHKVGMPFRRGFTQELLTMRSL